MLSSEQFKALRAEMEALPTTAQPLGFTGQEYAALAGKEWPAVETDALAYAMLIIESYQIDLRNSDQLLSPENIERLRAGETLAAIGFCQGSIYTGALARIRALRDKEATHADRDDDGPTPTR